LEPQGSHIALPCTVRGHFHHTLLERVPHAAHAMRFALTNAALYSDPSSSLASLSARERILPRLGGPSVFELLRPCVPCTLRCWRIRSFSVLSRLFRHLKV
jgi:hypothetical protein